jgi:Serine carboxypeptidase
MKTAKIYCAGNSRWVHSMEWSGQQGFNSSEEISFTVDGKEAGVLKSYGSLNFLKVLSEKSGNIC